MKKTALHILTLLAVLSCSVLLGACTRNHGDIGIWFGTWHVEQIIANGTRVNVGGDYFFQFQNKVFRVSQVSGLEQMVESFGTWDEADGGNMVIAFPAPDVFYIQMPGLESHNDFAVVRESSRSITFTKVDASGNNYTYILRKQP
ncbi:MAG: hypothetical protein IJV05_10960 [Muribaculaceae bacterium]|nr:hypothetical protein [Muribaculaceae bacterium]